MVEQAPYWPKKGIWKSISPKVEEMHWFSKSPARMKSTPSGPKPAFSKAMETASFCS
ncbi:unknown [Clostridium sp. CAG:1013]|nr:unknown [Clostridium sp. CAG:1013]